MAGSDAQRKKYTHLIQEWLRCEPERIKIRRHHIEQERIWREITTQDILDVLRTGAVVRIRPADSTLIWQGKDQNLRILECLCSLVSVDGQDTLFIQGASSLRVGTAYEKHMNDESLKKEWVFDHPEYELTQNGEVRLKRGMLK